MNKREVGIKNEEKAAEYLIDKGYECVVKNFYGNRGEIDLIMKKEKLYIFVEVKYRNSKVFGEGEYSIDLKKKRKIYKTAMEYITKENIQEYAIRFDAVIFFKTKINWVKDIIWGDELGF